MRRVPRALVILGVSLAMLASSFAAEAESRQDDIDQSERGPGASVEFDAGDVPIGAVVARGVKDGQTCKFDNLEASRDAGGLPTAWAVIRTNDSCEVSVAARWRGSFSDRPAGIAPGVEDAKTNEKSFTEAAGISDSRSLISGGVAALFACSTHKQQIVHYGFGGPLDVLTKLIGTMVVCENGSEFTDVSHTGTCVGTDLGAWEWVIEQCYSGGIIVGASIAQTIEKGDFHCSPRNQAPCSASNPDGYDHTLKTVEQKNLGGSATCFVSLTGIDVLGSYKDIIQGCS